MLYTESTSSIHIPNVQKYMRDELRFNFSDYDPYNSGEINTTLLAENASQYFNYYEDDNIPEIIFEIAHEMAEKVESSL